MGYGTLNMADLAQRVKADPSQPMLWFGIVFLFITFMIKSATFPFHFWQPDFHTAAPTPVSAMLSSVVLAANALMSAPAEKNFFEADRTMIALVESAAAESTATLNSSMNSLS
jgi:formate hydrogenlyase subunit 3/multisubunit Na+/H+ antiporter MnhD subunit